MAYILYNAGPPAAAGEGDGGKGRGKVLLKQIQLLYKKSTGI